ncbi:MAG: DHA2 family efflux MFS transporter permease subunit [Solirubrobacteraceae bacterium]
MNSSSPVSAAERPDGRPTVLAVTGAALFMIVLDNLIVISTLPSIQHSLHASLSSLQWIVNAYILSFAVLILTGTALGERFGRRRMFFWALLVFSVSSAAGALAPNVGLLIAARAIQGLGGAVLMPLTLTLLTAAYPGEGRGRALGTWSAIAGAGVAFGPIAGGLLSQALSWHWIFWINVPVGLIAAVATPRVLAESRGPSEPVDGLGLSLVSAGLLGVVWATVQGNDAGWGAPSTLAGYAAGAVALALFVLWESRAAHPMLPLRLFAQRGFSATNAAGFLFGFAMFAAFLMIVQFLSTVRHETPLMAGVWTLPWTIMPLLVSPIGARLGQRIAPPRALAGGLALVATSMLVLAVGLEPSSAPASLAPALAGIGIGIGIVIPNLTAVIMSSVLPADIGRASGTLSTARQLGAVFGVAVAVAVFGLTGSPATALSETAGVRAALVVAALGALTATVLALLAAANRRRHRLRASGREKNRSRATIPPTLDAGVALIETGDPHGRSTVSGSVVDAGVALIETGDPPGTVQRRAAPRRVQAAARSS